MKKYLTLVYLFVAAGLSAQQWPQYSLFLLNPYAISPAAAGLENSLVATGVYRQQWSGLEGAPVSQHLNAHLPLSVVQSGVGLKFDNEEIGAHRSLRLVASYAYQIEFGRQALLSAGISAGFLQYTLDGDKLRAPQGTYAAPVFTHADQVLPEGRVKSATPIFEAGVWLQWKNFETALGIQPVFAPALKASNAQGFGLKPVQQYTYYMAHQWDLAQNLTVKPGMLVKTDFVETQVEISAILRWKESIFAGASYRGFRASDRDAAVIMAGLRLNERTTLGYSFDIPLSALQSVSRGSHELLLRYNLNKPIGAGKLPPVIYNPRFF